MTYTAYMVLTDKSDLDTFEEAVRLFIQTMKRPQSWAVITQKAEVDIDRPAASILMILVSHEPQQCHLKDLVVLLGIEAPSVSRKLQQLEQSGLIIRQQDETDRRVFGLQITQTGRNMVHRLHDCQRQMFSQVLEAWPTTERQQFVGFFERFSKDIAHQYKVIAKQP